MSNNQGRLHQTHRPLERNDHLHRHPRRERADQSDGEPFSRSICVTLAVRTAPSRLRRATCPQNENHLCPCSGRIPHFA